MPPLGNKHRLLTDCYLTAPNTMTRIFFSIATLSTSLLVASFVLGLGIGDLYARPDPQTLQWKSVHLITGLAAALSVVFAHSIVVTYFIGTSRWCREVVDVYGLPATAAEASAQLKRRTFPWCLLGMLTVVVMGALGAAADPATGRLNTAAWADVHLAATSLGIALVVWSFYIAWGRIEANRHVIDGLVEEVHRRRRAAEQEKARAQ